MSAKLLADRLCKFPTMIVTVISVVTDKGDRDFDKWAA